MNVADKKLNLQTIVTIANLSVSIISLASVWAAWLSLKESRHLAEVQTYQVMVKEEQDVDQPILQDPSLRPYFRDGKAVDKVSGDYNKVAMLAEMRINAYDAVLTYPAFMQDSDIDGWKNTLSYDFKHSPIECEILRDNLNNYGDDTVSIGKKACNLP